MKLLDEILSKINWFLSAIDRAVHKDEKRPMIDLFGRNAEITHKAIVREYTAALEERDAKIAELKRELVLMNETLARYCGIEPRELPYTQIVFCDVVSGKEKHDE